MLGSRGSRAPYFCQKCRLWGIVILRKGSFGEEVRGHEKEYTVLAFDNVDNSGRPRSKGIVDDRAREQDPRLTTDLPTRLWVDFK